MRYSLVTSDRVMRERVKQILSRKLYVEGGLAKNYFRCVRDNRASLAQLALAIDKHKIVGWACLFFNSKKYEAWVFVSKSYRRKGIGTKCLQMVRCLCPVVQFDCARDFFKKQKGVEY